MWTDVASEEPSRLQKAAFNAIEKASEKKVSAHLNAYFIRIIIMKCCASYFLIIIETAFEKIVTIVIKHYGIVFICNGSGCYHAMFALSVNVRNNRY